MVSILPPKRGPWNTIADAMTKFGENAPDLLEKRYQREQGLNAIDDLQKGLESAKDPKTGQIDMTKALPLLAKAYTQNPALERSGIGQTFLQQYAAVNQANALADGISPASENISRSYQNQPDQNISPLQGQANPFISEETQQVQPASATISEGKKTSKDIDSIANQYIGEVRPDLVNPETQYGNIATFDSEIKQDLTPEEEGRLRQQLFDKYKNN